MPAEQSDAKESQAEPQQQQGKKDNNPQVMIALIGALATIGAAIATGFFGWLQSRPVAAPAPTPEQIVVVATPLASPTTIVDTATQEILLSPTPVPVAGGFLFASQVSASGEAIDAGSRFSPDVQTLYAVFRPDQVPPGLQLNVDNPNADSYYYTLRVRDNASLASFGWLWLHDGDVVNEFNMQVRPGDEIWLSLFDEDGQGGLFVGEDMLPPGDYTVYLLQGGNRFVSAPLTIAAEP